MDINLINVISLAYIGDAVFDANGKVKKAGKLQDSERYMYFRSDGYVDAGSRFRNIPNRVPFTDNPEVAAKNYVNAIKEGIKDADGFTGSDTEFKKLADKANEVKEQKAMLRHSFFSCRKNSLLLKFFNFL